MKGNKGKLLVLAAGIALVAYLLVAGPGSDDVTVEDELFSQYRLLMKYRAMADQFDDLGEASGELDKELASYEERFLTSLGPSLASAELQRILSDLAAGAGLSLQTVKPLPLLEKGDYIEVPLLFEFRGRIGGVRDFVRRIERAKTGLHVSKLAVSVVNVREPDTLGVKIAVHGIMRL